MQNLKQTILSVINMRARPSLWAIRTRKDSSVLVAAARDTLGMLYQEGKNEDHLKATMDWLWAAQDATADDGVSAFYDVRTGTWAPSYPETTGYIIPTFYDYSAYSGDYSYKSRASSMASWLLELQLESGAFPIGPLWPDWERVPIVFDTGMIIQGLCRAFQETDHSKYLAAAKRAGDWLVEIQAADGSWREFTSSGHLHTYNLRAAWALLQLSEYSQDEQHREKAIRNLEWGLTQQTQDGWFHNAGFAPEEDPLTHTIAYTLRGLLESGQLLSDRRFTEAACRGAEALRERQEQDGYLRARYGPGWRSRVNWSCLSGNVQMAIVWFKLYEITGDDAFFRAAVMANKYVNQRQSLNSHLPGIAGGVAGSSPIYGDYEPYRNLNWAAKFLADSLLYEERLGNASFIHQ